MELVFSKDLYIKIIGKKAYKEYLERCSHDWVKECDGLTKEQCEMLGYMISDNWCKLVD